MYKQLIKSGLYTVAGSIRSFDFEWDVTNAKPTLDQFGQLTEDGDLTDEESAIICREIAEAPGVPVGLKKLLMGAAWFLDNPWIDFKLSLAKYRSIYDDLKLWWSDNKFTTKEFALFLERIGDTLTEVVAENARW